MNGIFSTFINQLCDFQIIDHSYITVVQNQKVKFHLKVLYKYPKIHDGVILIVITLKEISIEANLSYSTLD